MEDEKTLGTVCIESITLFLSINQTDQVYFEQFINMLFNQSGWPQIEEMCEWLHKHDIQAYATDEFESASPMSKFKAKKIVNKMNRYFFKYDMMIPSERINDFYVSLSNRA